VLAIGDWGWDADLTGQTAVAAAMQAYAKKIAATPDALFMLGDNFYGTLASTTDTRWQTQFEHMYPASAFPGPAYGMPGNHDYEFLGNNVDTKYTVELAYAAQGASRWTMPGQSYVFTLGPSASPYATVICLDSNVPQNGGSTMTDAQRIAQNAYLKMQLAQTRTTPFTIVIAHHPLYSDGPHGDNAQLIADWGPLFKSYNVHAYLAGHDHDLQHLEFAGLPTSFVCTGAGGASLYPYPGSTSAAKVTFGQESYGFIHLQATRTLLTFRYLDPTGAQLHAFTKAVDGTMTIV